MTVQSNQPLDVDVALQRITEMMKNATDAESVPLDACLGRILAEPAVSPIALPPFDNSAMDGYAVADNVDQDLTGRRYKLIGTSAAGHPFSGSLAAGECVRIFTGAVVPEGCRRVVLQEDTTAADDTILITGTPHARSNIRPTGHDVAPGEELDPAGTEVNAYRLGRYAASGLGRLRVHTQPTVGVFSTGDELAALDVAPEELPAGAIYESNRHALIALLAELPVRVLDLGNLRDDPNAVRDALRTAGETCDVVITSGGVSVGDHDHVKGAVEALGRIDFWRLNLKPGKPLAFGKVNEAWFFGLPGNPVSTIVTWLLVAKPAIWSLCGRLPQKRRALSASLSSGLHHTPGRTEYQRGLYVQNEDGRLSVASSGHQASNRLSSFASANCLIEVPSDAGDLDPGESVRILPMETL